MDDLVQWLGQQLDEDERIAKAATDGPWHVDHELYPESINAADGVQVIAGGRWGGEASVFESTEDALHIARHDPARVLREIDAKRRMLARHHAAPVPPGSEWAEEYPYCAAHAYKAADDTVVYPVELKNCLDLRDLAAPYANRPGYREEWRP